MTDKAIATFLQDRERLIAIACGIVKNRAVAEELVQESWLRWQEHNYPAHKARSIFGRIVANLARDSYRRRQTETRLIKEIVWEGGFEADSERLCIVRQDLCAVVQALLELPERTVTIFRMHCADGLNCAEIGRRLGLSRSRTHGLLEDAMVHVMLRLYTD